MIIYIMANSLILHEGMIITKLHTQHSSLNNIHAKESSITVTSGVTSKAVIRYLDAHSQGGWQIPHLSMCTTGWQCRPPHVWISTNACHQTELVYSTVCLLVFWLFGKVSLRKYCFSCLSWFSLLLHNFSPLYVSRTSVVEYFLDLTVFLCWVLFSLNGGKHAQFNNVNKLN